MINSKQRIAIGLVAVLIGFIILFVVAPIYVSLNLPQIIIDPTDNSTDAFEDMFARQAEFAGVARTVNLINSIGKTFVGLGVCFTLFVVAMQLWNSPNDDSAKAKDSTLELQRRNQDDPESQD